MTLGGERDGGTGSLPGGGGGGGGGAAAGGGRGGAGGAPAGIRKQSINIGHVLVIYLLRILCGM